jgi:hypothetical protein
LTGVNSAAVPTRAGSCRVISDPRRIHHLKPRSRSEFVTTETLEKAMASEASMG